jgi:hypothetical protein
MLEVQYSDTWVESSNDPLYRLYNMHFQRTCIQSQYLLCGITAGALSFSSFFSFHFLVCFFFGFLF